MPMLRIMLFAVALALVATDVTAQAWPAKPVRLVVAGAAGSAPDIIARLIADRLTQAWGQQVIVDNRPGAAGNLGTAAAARAAPDGYTFLFGQAAPLAMNQHTFKSLDFDPERDFVPVVGLGISPMMIAVNNDLPFKTVAELIAAAKAQPGKINFGTSSSRNIPHLTGELLNGMAGIKLVHVPYKSNAQAAAETASGLTQIYIDGIPPMAAHMKSGRLRVIAVSAAQRLPNFSDIPAVSETVPDFAFVGWFAIVAPTGMPAEVVAKVNGDINALVKAPDIASRLLAFGLYDPGGTPEDLARFLRAERTNYAQAVKAAGIQPE
jgi:tripartite-type tricarboxylate transporter receptor subunit TctC